MDSRFDVLVLGTGLTESIAAAALAKAGAKVVHIDTSDYYGGDEASFSPEELVKWTGRHSARFSPLSFSQTLPESSRQYSVSLAPSLISSTGPFISSLIDSGVARYGGFKLLERVGVYSSDGIKTVPGSKRDIFKSNESVVDKRRLMRFLTFTAGNFEEAAELEGRQELPFVRFLEEVFLLNQKLVEAIAYALAFCTSAFDTTLPALQRTRQYLRSAGRYGPSPFLVAHYGGLGELAQGFCRTCAVSGGTYILGRRIISLEATQVSETPRFRATLDDFPETITANIVISSEEHLPPQVLRSVPEGHQSTPSHPNSMQHQSAFCIAIVDQPISFSSADLPSHSTSANEQGSATLPSGDDDASQEDDVDSALLIFPPNALPAGHAQGAVSVLINGEHTMSCPRGKHILYLSTPIFSASTEVQAVPTSNPETLLRPYLAATLSLTTSPPPAEAVFTMFYTRNAGVPSALPASPGREQGVILCPTLPSHFAENADVAARCAEALFRDAVRHLRMADESDTFWPPLPRDPDDDDEW